MNIDEYQTLACRTMGDASITTLALGIAGESGEVADLVKKHVGHGHELDREKLKEELGDVLWYVATMARALGKNLSSVSATATFGTMAYWTEQRPLDMTALALSAASGNVSALVEDRNGSPNPHHLLGLLGRLPPAFANCCRAAGIDLEEVAAANIDKLRRRYPDGFSSERSRNREE